MTVLCVVGARPGVGSTAVAASLAAAWRHAGRKAAVDKPLALADGDADAVLLAVEGPGIVSPDGKGKRPGLAAAAKRGGALGETAEGAGVDAPPLARSDGGARAAPPAAAKRRPAARCSGCARATTSSA